MPSEFGTMTTTSHKSRETAYPEVDNIMSLKLKIVLL